jgi:hypothetical protein
METYSVRKALPRLRMRHLLTKCSGRTDKQAAMMRNIRTRTYMNKHHHCEDKECGGVLELGSKHLCSLFYNVHNLARPPSGECISSVKHGDAPKAKCIQKLHFAWVSTMYQVHGSFKLTRS